MFGAVYRNMEIIHALDTHHPKIKEIAENTWPITFAGILSVHQIDYMLEMMYSLDSLKKQSDQGHHQFLLGKVNHEFMSYASYEINYADQSVTKIHKIYILPAFQGRGSGKDLIDFIRMKALAAGNNALRLNVHKNNKAQLFYNKMGFQEIKREVIDIGHGYLMDDVQMEQSLI